MDIKKTGMMGALISVAAAVIIFWGVRSLAFILAPLAMAMVITIAILPLPGWFTKKGVKPGLALILTILAVVGVIALVALITIASVGKLAGYLPTYAANLSTQTSAVEPASTGSASGLAARIGISVPVTATSTIQDSTVVTSTAGSGAAQSLAGLNLSNLSSVVSPSQVSGTAEAIVVAAAKAVGMMFLVLFIFAFMLSAAFSLRDKSFLGLSEDNPAMVSVQQFTVEVRQYVNIMTVINFLVAIGDTLILVLLGIPFAALWGILAFFMGFIPSIGWWISLIPPFLIAWAQFGVGTAVIVLLSYILINGGVQNIVQPKMMGKGLRISPLVVFVSVIVWATVLGGMGALIAVPMTMIVMKILELSPSTRWITALMRIGSESDSDEEKKEDAQAFEKLRGLGSRVRDAIPFGSSSNEKTATRAADHTAES
jgi:predicted PurR-regulated permease PerM